MNADMCVALFSTGVTKVFAILVSESDTIAAECRGCGIAAREYDEAVQPWSSDPPTLPKKASRISIMEAPTLHVVVTSTDSLLPYLHCA